MKTCWNCFQKYATHVESSKLRSLVSSATCLCNNECYPSLRRYRNDNIHLIRNDSFSNSCYEKVHFYFRRFKDIFHILVNSVYIESVSFISDFFFFLNCHKTSSLRLYFTFLFQYLKFFVDYLGNSFFNIFPRITTAHSRK